MKRRDYGNEPTTLRLSKYRTVVVTDRYGVEELRFRSIYKDADGARQTSDWTNLSDQADKYELQVDMNYAPGSILKPARRHKFRFPLRVIRRYVPFLHCII